MCSLCLRTVAFAVLKVWNIPSIMRTLNAWSKLPEDNIVNYCLLVYIERLGTLRPLFPFLKHATSKLTDVVEIGGVIVVKAENKRLNFVLYLVTLLLLSYPGCQILPWKSSGSTLPSQKLVATLKEEVIVGAGRCYLPTRNSLVLPGDGEQENDVHGLGEVVDFGHLLWANHKAI